MEITSSPVSYLVIISAQALSASFFVLKPDRVICLRLPVSGSVPNVIAKDQVDPRFVWEAARRARFDGFIREQEQGMDTVIGERGMKLSGEKN